MQKTINKSFNIEGVTLHSGEKSNLSVKPATANTGIVFRRVDIKNSNEESLIEAKFNNVSVSDLCTKITNKYGISVSTIEHLMSALHGMGIDNAIVEVDCDELPILDGSSLEYVRKIEAVGLKSLNVEKKYIAIVTGSWPKNITKIDKKLVKNELRSGEREVRVALSLIHI